MPKPADLVYMQSVTGGTGDLLIEEVQGKRTFSNAFSTGSGNTFDYAASERASTQWEVGIGYCSAAGTLVRQSVYNNHLGTTAKVSFTTGIKDIVNDIPASRQVQTTATSVTTGHAVVFEDADGTVIGSAGAAPYIVGGTDVAVADGGTGASDAATARTNLELGTMSTQNANAVNISGGTVSGSTFTGHIEASTIDGTLTPASTNVDVGSATSPFGVVAGDVVRASELRSVTTRAALPVNCNINLGLSASVGSNACTVAVLTASGATPSTSNPVYIPMNNDTPATGSHAWVRVTAENKITIPSGATLGVSTGEAFRIWVVMFNDGELGVKNCYNGVDSIGTTDHQISALSNFDESTAAAIGTASDSPGVMYSVNAQSAKPYAILGFAEWSTAGLATAGTWNVSPRSVINFIPGMKTPGDVVQAKFFNQGETLNDSNGSWTRQSTDSITMQSACNVVRYESGVRSYLFGSGALTGMAIARGSTSNVISNSQAQTYMAGPSEMTLSGGNLCAYDKPNSHGTVNYNIVSYRTGSGNESRVSMWRELTEIMT